MRSGTDVRSSQHHLHHHCYINWTLAKCSIYECNITSTASSLMSPLPSHLAINQQYHSKPTLTECSVTLRWALPAIGWVFFFLFYKDTTWRITLAKQHEIHQHERALLRRRGQWDGGQVKGHLMVDNTARPGELMETEWLAVDSIGKQIPVHLTEHKYLNADSVFGFIHTHTVVTHLDIFVPFP